MLDTLKPPPPSAPSDAHAPSGVGGASYKRKWAVKDVLLAWGPALLWAAAIFYVSGQNTWTVFDGPLWLRILRKSGHVFEYALLALLVGRGLLGWLTSWGALAPSRLMHLRVWQLGAAISTLYAVTDEIHQSFVPGRLGQGWDVLLDALSATAALGVWYIVRVRTTGPRR